MGTLSSTDRTNNQAGMLTHYVDLEVRTGAKDKQMRFLVMGLGNEDLILGYPWLSMFEPQFNWANRAIDTRYLPVIIQSLDWRTLRVHPTIMKTTTEPDCKPLSMIRQAQILDELKQETFAFANISTELAQKAGQYMKAVAIPPRYQKFARISSEEASQQFPPHRPWDHAIELKKNASSTLNCKVYPTMAEEKVALQEWLDDQLQKGYITVSNSPYASPFF